MEKLSDDNLKYIKDIVTTRITFPTKDQNDLIDIRVSDIAAELLAARKELSALREAVRWVPVEEVRASGRYLLKFKEVGITGHNHQSTAWRMRNDDNEPCWFIDCDEMEGFTPFEFIPLPLPPVEEKE